MEIGGIGLSHRSSKQQEEKILKNKESIFYYFSIIYLLLFIIIILYTYINISIFNNNGKVLEESPLSLSVWRAREDVIQKYPSSIQLQ